jgi:hypothetical protein
VRSRLSSSVRFGQLGSELVRNEWHPVNVPQRRCADLHTSLPTAAGPLPQIRAVDQLDSFANRGDEGPAPEELDSPMFRAKDLVTRLGEVL